MADNKKSNVSETFGKYAGSSSKGRGSAAEPKNVTSDMWTPISGGNDASSGKAQKKAPEKKLQPKKAAKTAKAEPKKGEFISEGRGAAAKEGNNRKKTASKKKKSRIPKGKPISELTQEKLSKNSDVKKRQKLSQRERAYDERIKEGKSPGEISRERAEIKRKKRIKRNVITVALFITFVLAFVGIYTYAKGAPVAEITVEGESIYTSEEIISAAEIEIGANMFALSEKNISALVSEKLPYVHSVEISRKLPDKLLLTVTASYDNLLLVCGKSYISVDSEGKVLSLKKKKLSDGLYRINGLSEQTAEVGTAFEPSAENLEKYNLAVELVRVMEDDGVILKGVINVKSTNNVSVLYDDRIMIYLGDCSNLAERISLAGKVLNSPQTEGKEGYIDLRFDKAAYFNEGSTKLK